ncbi:MAG TPA: hypothetical protein VN253_27065, partial [Kofleriaceae bacterium]|nr:hypothetical protein [Kofleriaceae bacterium]
MSEPRSRALLDRLSSETITVRSVPEFLEVGRDARTVSFVDSSTLAELERAAAELGIAVEQMTPPMIAICEEPLQTAIGWLPSRPWLGHVINTGMLQHPLAAEHLRNVTATLTTSGRPRLLDWLGSTVTGRRVRLAHASRRVERLERMTQFFESRGVGSRTIQLLRDIAEELLTNAFYDAPVAAGLLEQPISRTQD